MNIATSRTGTARWKGVRKQALREAQTQGVTNCPDCGGILNYEQGRLPNSAEVDHIIPHARGGTDTLENVRVCCRQCNQRRGSKWLSASARNETRTTTTLVTW